MRKTLLAALCASLIVLTGCAALNSPTAQQSASYTLNVGVLANQINLIDPEIAQAESEIKAHKAAFSSKEWAELQSAQSNINSARDVVHQIVSGANGATTVVSLSQIQAVYSSAKSAYLSAKPIIQAHESALTKTQVQQLKTLDQNAKQLNQDYARVQAGNVKGVNVTQMLQTALTLASLGAKIAVAAGA